MEKKSLRRKRVVHNTYQCRGNVPKILITSIFNNEICAFRNKMEDNFFTDYLILYIERDFIKNVNVDFYYIWILCFKIIFFLSYMNFIILTFL